MARALKLLIATLLVAGCGATGGTTSTPPPPVAPTVTVTEAASLRDAGAFVLDVREPAEWTAGHIPGATLIPLGSLPSRLSEVPRDRTILVVCHSGNRSAQGRDILLGAGFPSVTSLDGGMTEWAAAGMPIEPGG